ncbi:MAG: hypothetical protein HFACDABA_01321 [Anaerolineales bacterium]|nr:hypothetical protein [Anaerolineales bacterium]
MSAEFEKLTPSKLAKAAIVPQVLDNQWVPNTLLDTMIKEGKSLKDTQKERSKHVIKEWRRALVYGEQVIVNRAFMFNNEVVVDDYDDSESREQLKTLLNTKVIVPYLVFEDSPDQRPTFDTKDSLWNAWTDIVHDTHMSCVKLDWGDQNDDFKRLSGIYHNYVQTLNTEQRAEHLAGYLKIPKGEFPEFRKRLKDVASYAFNLADTRLITRNDLYKEFVVTDGTNIAEGYYSKKPYAAKIKQIVDLKYNVNLPDAMGRYSLTPEGSPPRAALGDLEETIQANIISPENVKDILQALRGLAFDQITRGMYLKSLGDLNLADVIKTRETEEWEMYRKAMLDLLANPLQFPHLSAVFYAKFEKLNTAITRIRAEREQAKWDPWIKLLISIGAKAIEIAINPADPSQKILTTLGTGILSTGITPFLMRFTVGASTFIDADLDVSLDFMRGNVQSGREVWNDMLGQLRNTPGFKELVDEIKTDNDTNLSQPENLGVNYYGY